ncbi:MAG: M20 family metallo-hydrolase [Bacteroidota bacterium]
MFDQYLQLLQNLIATPSLSKDEAKTAEWLKKFLVSKNVPFQQLHNNIWAHNKYFNSNLPTILLNSHHDTVKPAATYTRNPYEASLSDGKLYGLGSNDAGGCLVALLATFLHFYERSDLSYNLIFVASAEEEISGKNGIAVVLSELGDIAVGIVGEPTLLQMAVAEKGLMVIDGVAKGVAGHAAREEGESAIYKALTDIELLKNLELEHVSTLLGHTKISVTQIEAGHQHNVVPDACKFVMDVRTNEFYPNKKLFDHLQKITQSELTARSFRLNSSQIPLDHPLVKRGQELGLSHYGSPTLSDQALMPFPTLKIGPGDSARSHTADEFIYVREIEEGIELYTALLEGLELI